ncbi:MAG: cobalamin synthesis protein P47K [Prevotellaceae bacterium]|jgi:G3E family GTPase|nr:cobalamin synthesis protein P47K [Prevotellaceae bacterium]
MHPLKIIFAGGFLGAGKTTLAWKAAQCLMKKGLRPALITNDQASGLVDTALLQQQGLKVAEVSGSCFCCNFNGLVVAVKNVAAEAPIDVIIAEPVGSCTDLSATILQPLKQRWSRELSVAPLSVLADPERLAPILRGETAGLHADAAYIFRKQLEESDVILITKVDTLDTETLAALLAGTRKTFPFARVLPVSAATGQGVDEWIEESMKRTDAGQRIAEVDYDVYARGEAVLGWLNGTVLLKGKSVNWDAVAHDFLSQLSQQLDSGSYSVGHVKAILESGVRYITGNLTSKANSLSLRNSAGTGDAAKLTVNARVETNPDRLSALVREALDVATCKRCEATVVAWRCLQPGRPNPTYRLATTAPFK